MAPLFCHTNWRAPGRGGANFPKSARLPNIYAVFIKLSYAFCVFFPRVGEGNSWPKRSGKNLSSEQRGSRGGASDVLQQHRARGELRNFNARGRQMCAPVGGIYGASIRPYKLEGTSVRHMQIHIQIQIHIRIHILIHIHIHMDIHVHEDNLTWRNQFYIFGGPRQFCHNTANPLQEWIWHHPNHAGPEVGPQMFCSNTGCAGS